MNFIKSFDEYAAPFQINFEDGHIAFNEKGKSGSRAHKNTLGIAIQKIKSKISINKNKQFKESANFEGG